jgi:hypothetical protein
MSTQSPEDNAPPVTPGPPDDASGLPAPPAAATRSRNLDRALGAIAIIYGLVVMSLELAVVGDTGTDFGFLESMMVTLPPLLLVGIVYAIIIGLRGGIARTCAVICGVAMLAPFLIFLAVMFSGS